MYVIAVRHLYQSCDKYSPCDRNSECQISGSTEICQCSDNYTDINGRCVKCEYLTDSCSATILNNAIYSYDKIPSNPFFKDLNNHYLSNSGKISRKEFFN